MKQPVQALQAWIRRQPPKIKVFLASVSAIAALVVIRLVVYDHDNLFIAAEAVHALGISVLIFKLATEKTCAGLSLKSQELTAIFLGARLYCSYVMEYDVHTILDLATLTATIWVIYMMRFKLNASYMLEKDNVSVLYVVIPCALLSLVVHPTTQHYIVNRIIWAFCVYLESVSVLPQLRIMQNTKIVEPFTAHYVFALGVARFLSCAHWILQVWDTRGRLLTALGYGMWPSLVLLSEIVQTFILADFCYYYVQSVMGGRLVLRLPSGPRERERGRYVILFVEYVIFCYDPCKFHQKMQKGGSCQFSTPRPQTGGNHDAILDKSVRKEKLRRLSSVGIFGETDELSHSMFTNSASKRVNLPKKLSNLSDTIKYASTPRKLRSALEKRQHESQKTSDHTSPDSRKEMDGFEWQLKDCTKKHKTAVGEYNDLKQSLITKDEEEAAQALFALAQTFTDTCLNKTSEVEPSSMHTVPPNEAEDTDGKNVSQKRCLVHVYICRFIKVLQTTESEGAAHVNVIS
ncbi:hypothetical protein L1987_10783 [Smallanthus sonchifolius]|uniref:Uncharacterized protein n=1 Tax=Smallanthus sonchifolius TaxID=185202 RepID=A0ACB9J9H1_9ASTR|nr:hypothetical protein L1987_10783 [Smallanthus sonchifolius]